jgi:tRNA pseudouridine55 synthase
MDLNDRVILVDKPPGVTSFRAVEMLRRASKTRKAGHCGSLDPAATGLLVLTTGVATRLSSLFVDQPKEYEARIRFGRSTDTYDADGTTTGEAPVPALDQARLDEILATFVGEIQQVPPMVSALKHQGKRLYALARQGVEVERQPRPVMVYGLDVVARGDSHIDLRVRCGRGCYVRSLAHDLGGLLGVPSHLEQLRRTAIGPYRVEQATGLNDLREQVRDARQGNGDHSLSSVLDVSRAFDFLPALYVRSGFEAGLRNGVQPMPHFFVDMPERSGPHRLLSEDRQRMLGMCTADGRRQFAIIRIQRLFQNPLSVESQTA